MIEGCRTRMAETKTKVMRFGGRALARLIKHVAKTSRITYEPADLPARLRAAHPCIIASWHGQFMMLAILHPGGIKVSAMVARHGDAELIGEALRHLDTELIRGAGAGTRKKDRGGASALRAAVRALTDETSLVMTADIPPGPARVAGVFFFACNMDPSGTKEFKFTPIIGRCISRHMQDYAQLSDTPGGFNEFSEAVGLMQRTQPNYSAKDLAQISVPVAIVHSEHDEFIKREHAEYLARSIPNAEFIFLPDVGHFAPLQRPGQFNTAMLAFLGKVLP